MRAKSSARRSVCTKHVAPPSSRSVNQSNKVNGKVARFAGCEWESGFSHTIDRRRSRGLYYSPVYTAPSPSGKASASDADIRWFESIRGCHIKLYATSQGQAPRPRSRNPPSAGFCVSVGPFADPHPHFAVDAGLASSNLRFSPARQTSDNRHRWSSRQSRGSTEPVPVLIRGWRRTRLLHPNLLHVSRVFHGRQFFSPFHQHDRPAHIFA